MVPHDKGKARKAIAEIASRTLSSLLAKWLADVVRELWAG
ncbi:Hypothetical protein CulFRC58_1715 [Corynebacterium ulcerans FRC58]|uniref:Transposase n=1 Tax=Corynebacterium ulcerans FRC58 TaxID=1408268 RepID=A0ABM5U292_CORUL|nr:Hypothetical protein CulFRC58_1715 [Corynebacterium ulcerans FRC58]